MKPPYLPLEEHIESFYLKPYAYCCYRVKGNQPKKGRDLNSIFKDPPVWWEFKSRHKGHKRGWTMVDTIDLSSKGLMDSKVRYKNIKTCPYCKRALRDKYKRDMLYQERGRFKDIKYLDGGEQKAKVLIKLDSGTLIGGKVKLPWRSDRRRYYLFKYKMTKTGEEYVTHTHCY